MDEEEEGEEEEEKEEGGGGGDEEEEEQEEEEREEKEESKEYISSRGRPRRERGDLIFLMAKKRKGVSTCTNFWCCTWRS